jgi:serine/threonine protein kinase
MKKDGSTLTQQRAFSSSYVSDDERLCVKTYKTDPITNLPITKDLFYPLVPARYSHDTWSLGLVMFELCAGIPFFLANSEDNIQADSMFDLFKFTDQMKKKRLTEVHNPQARNLVAQMLTKNPLQRPTMTQILNHPFITGKNAARMVCSWLLLHCTFISPFFDLFFIKRSERTRYLMCLLVTEYKVIATWRSCFMIV